MGLIGGGLIGIIGNSKQIQLTSSTDTFTIVDQDGFPMARFDANGNLLLKGGVKRI